jgi:hypothetical protein
MALFSKPKREQKPFSIIDQGVVISMTLSQKNRLLLLKLIEQTNWEKGYFRLADLVTIADIDFYL